MEKLPIRKRHDDGDGDDGNGRDADIAVIRERLDKHDSEIALARATREQMIPRIMLVEQAVLALEKEVPRLTAAIDEFNKELIAQRTSRKLVLQIAGWGLALLTTISGAILSAHAISVLQSRAATNVSITTPAAKTVVAPSRKP